MNITANFKLKNNPMNPVTINATPNEGYEFVNWTENDVELSTETTFEFVPTKDTTIVGNFQKKTYMVNVLVEGFGTVSGDGSYQFGDEATLIANPDEHNKFIGWFKNDELLSNNTEYKFVVNNNTDIVAKFEKIVYNVNLIANPTDGGTLTMI